MEDLHFDCIFLFGGGLSLFTFLPIVLSEWTKVLIIALLGSSKSKLIMNELKGFTIDLSGSFGIMSAMEDDQFFFWARE